jgi:hypothetical protein
MGVGYACDVFSGLGLPASTMATSSVGSAMTTSSMGSATMDLVRHRLDHFLVDLICRRRAFLLPPLWLPTPLSSTTLLDV